MLRNTMLEDKNDVVKCMCYPRPKKMHRLDTEKETSPGRGPH